MTSREEFFKDRVSGIDTEHSSVEAALRQLVNKFPAAGTFPDLKRKCKAQPTYRVSKGCSCIPCGQGS